MAIDTLTYDENKQLHSEDAARIIEEVSQVETKALSNTLQSSSNVEEETNNFAQIVEDQTNEEKIL